MNDKIREIFWDIGAGFQYITCNNICVSLEDRFKKSKKSFLHAFCSLMYLIASVITQ